MLHKKRYILFCKNRTDVPIFMQPFWLDTVAENWDVVLLETASSNATSPDIIAALPFCWKGNFLTKRIYLPFLSFYQSPVFFHSFNVNEQQKIVEKLLTQLPKTIKSYFKFSPEYNTIQLKKSTYKKYETYILQPNDAITLSNNHKRNVQKGIKSGYRVEISKDIEASFELINATFTRKKMASKVNLDAFITINKMVKKQHAGNTYNCIDSNQHVLATAFVVHDATCAYYLLSGYDTNCSNSGAMTFLLHELIQLHQKENRTFNFCGSTQNTIAHFFEGFGAKKQAISIWENSIF